MPSPHSTDALRSLSRNDSKEPSLTPPPRYPWRTRIAIPAGIIVALLALIGWSARELLLPVTEVRIVPVVMHLADEPLPAAGNTSSQLPGSKAHVAIQAAGWIEPDPYAIAVAALTDGTVHEILTLEGQPVRAGEVLVRLIDDDAKLTVARAEAELALRRAEADAAQRRWNHPIDRDRELATTAALMDETSAELKRLSSEIAAEQAREKDLADQLKRREPLAAQQLISEREFQSTRFRLEAQQAVLAAIKARLPVLEAQLRRHSAEAKAAADRAELRIDDKRQLEVAKASLRLAEVQLSEAKLRLQRTEVRSPSDGVVMSLLVERGSKLMLNADSHASTYIARLYDPAKLQVRVDVPLADAEKVQIGMPAEVLIESIPGRVLKGEVTRAVHQADVAKNTLQFKVRLLETVPALRPEMLARARFLARPASGVGADFASKGEGGTGSHLPFVPESLVQRNGEVASVVTVDRAANVARVRKITLGQTRHNGWIAVVDGLAAGDVLIAEPRDVRDGRRVRVAGEFDGQYGKDGL